MAVKLNGWQRIAVIFSVLWFASLFVIHNAPVSAVSVPYLGFVPTPVALLAATLLAGYVLANLVTLDSTGLQVALAYPVSTGALTFVGVIAYRVAVEQRPGAALPVRAVGRCV